MIAAILAAWSILAAFTTPAADNAGTCSRPRLVAPVAESLTVHWRAYAVPNTSPVYVNARKPIEDSTRVARGVPFTRLIPVERDTATYWIVTVWPTRLTTRHNPRTYLNGCARSILTVPRVR